MSTSPLSPGSAAAVALLSSPERQRTVNTSTFEGYEIKFRDDGHIAGNGISAWIARFVQVLTKLVFFLFTPRQIIKLILQFNRPWRQCLFYFPPQDSDNCVALTFDDAPGQRNSLCDKILELLDAFDAKATFFVTSSYVSLNEKNKVDTINCYKKGHELANHMPEDKAYNKMSKEDFAFQLKETEQCLSALKQLSGKAAGEGRDQLHKWFRPPCARISHGMLEILESEGFKVALGDVFANDVLLQDVKYMGGVVEKYIQPGSIIVIHVPDVGFREKNLEEARVVLEILKRKGLRPVTLSHLYNKCHSAC